MNISIGNKGYGDGLFFMIYNLIILFKTQNKCYACMHDAHRLQNSSKFFFDNDAIGFKY